MLAACLSCSLPLACKRADSTGGGLSDESAATATAAPVASPSAEPPITFAGTYHSTEGLATIDEQGARVTIAYPGGHADCTSAGKKLTCTWHEGEDYGAANLTQIQGRKLVGTWGVGKSATSGGTWEFVPTATAVGDKD